MDIALVIVIVLALLICGGVFLYFKRKKNMDQMFLQVYESSKQIPKQKKQSFLLLMFNENIQAAKNKNASPKGRLNNPKYVEIQMIHMANILRDRSKVTDKNLKRALYTLDAYLQWEKSFNSKNKETA
jgi:hypothetical protein